MASLPPLLSSFAAKARLGAVHDHLGEILDALDGQIFGIDQDRLIDCHRRLHLLKSEVYASMKTKEREWGLMHQELCAKGTEVTLMRRAFLEKVQLPRHQTDWADRLFFHLNFYTDPTILSQVIIEFARDMISFLEFQELSRQFIVCGKRHRRFN